MFTNKEINNFANAFYYIVKSIFTPIIPLFIIAMVFYLYQLVWAEISQNNVVKSVDMKRSICSMLIR